MIEKVSLFLLDCNSLVNVDRTSIVFEQLVIHLIKNLKCDRVGANFHARYR